MPDQLSPSSKAQAPYSPHILRCQVFPEILLPAQSLRQCTAQPRRDRQPEMSKNWSEYRYLAIFTDSEFKIWSRRKTCEILTNT